MRLYGINPVLFTCIAFVVAVVSSVYAATPTYMVGVEEQDSLPHYHFNGDNPGPLYEALEAFAKQEDIKFKYVLLPVRRVKSKHSLEKFDFKLPDNPFWGNQHELKPFYSDPILWIDSATIVLDKNKSMNRNEFKVIAIFDGFIPQKHWQKKIQNGQVSLVEAPSNKLLTQYLYKGLVDGVNSDLATIKYQAEALGYDTDRLIIAEHAPVRKFGYRLSTMKHPEIIKKFNLFLLSYKKN
jgi:ABC-type amino acid transport substrate-binding protein